MAEQQVIARSIVRSSLGVAAISLLLLALNLAAQASIASRFGTSSELDAYWLAFTIVISLAGFYGTVVIDPFLPRFVRTESSEARDHFASAVLVWTLLAGVLIAAAVYLFGPAVGRLAAPGFDAAKDEQARRLILLLAAFPALLFLVSFATGLLAAAKVFAAPRAVALAGPAAVLIVVVTQSSRWGVEAIAAGTLVGGAVQALLLAVLVWRSEVRIRLTSRHLLSPAVVGLARATLPMLVIGVAIIVSALIDRSAASTLGEGAVSVLSYGEGIQSRLLVLLFLPVVAVVYPYLAEAQREDDFNQRFAFATRFALALLIPAAVFTGVFSELAVDILLRRGAFTLDQTRAVAPVLTVFMAGLIPYALLLLATRGVLVRGYLWRLSTISVAVVLIKAAAMPWFARQWGVEGIAALVALSMAGSLVVTLRVMFGSFAEIRGWLAAVLPYVARIVLAVALAIVAATGIDAVTPFEGELVAGPGWAPPGLRALTSEFVRLGIAGVLFLGVVGLAYQWLGVVTVQQLRRGLSGLPDASEARRR